MHCVLHVRVSYAHAETKILRTCFACAYTKLPCQTTKMSPYATDTETSELNCSVSL